jgi:hypothetical protein
VQLAPNHVCDTGLRPGGVGDLDVKPCLMVPEGGSELIPQHMVVVVEQLFEKLHVGMAPDTSATTLVASLGQVWIWMWLFLCGGWI